MKLFYKIAAIPIVLIVGFIVQKNLITPLLPLQHQPTRVSPKLNAYDSQNRKGVFHGQTVYSTKTPDTVDPKILGTNAGSKRIDIDLTNQRLYAFEDNYKVYDFVISSGLYDWTPRGAFNIWIKLRYSHMSGGSRALGTYYHLPNVPYVMYFSNSQIPAWRGFGIHGTYWHDDFGRPKSHGCINLRTEDAEKLYYWATPDLRGNSSIRSTADNPGTEIHIYGKYQ